MGRKKFRLSAPKGVNNFFEGPCPAPLLSVLCCSNQKAAPVAVTSLYLWLYLCHVIIPAAAEPRLPEDFESQAVCLT